MRHCRKSREDSTLIEVLVAMTIVGLGVVTLLQIFSLGLRLQARSTVRTEAVVQGARVMDELLARKKLARARIEARSAMTGAGAVKFRPSAMPIVLGLSEDLGAQGSRARDDRPRWRGENDAWT